MTSDDPLWFKSAIIYELHVRAFFDSNGDGKGDIQGLITKLPYLQDLGVNCLWVLPMYPSPLRDDGYDIADFYAIHPDYGTLEDFQRLVDAAHARGIRILTELVVNHTSDQHPWFQKRAQQPGQPQAQLVRVERHRPEVSGGAHHLHRHRALQLDLGPGGQAVLLAPLLQPPAGSQLRQPRGPGGDAERHALLAAHGRGRVPLRRRALPLRARGHQLREPPGDARFPQAPAGHHRPRVPGPGAARRGEPVAIGRPGVLRRRRRVPHGVPLPGDAPHLHVGAARGAHAHRGDHAADARDPRDLSVGHLPAQPRRADPGDGHRRGPRLHVQGVRQGPADEAEPGHPAAPGPADGQRAAAARAAPLAPLQPARNAGHVLRRRDRNGRQHLPRRPQRGPDADAVDAGPQRRLQPRRLRPTLRPGDRGHCVWLPGAQRGGAGGDSWLAPQLGSGAHPGPQAAPGPLDGQAPVREPAPTGR